MYVLRVPQQTTERLVRFVAACSRFCASAILLGVLLAGPELRAQPAPVPDTARSALVISGVRFTGDTFFDDDRLEERVRTTSNRRFLGIPGLTWWRWVYNVGASGALGRRLSEALMRTGEAPAVLDTTLLAADVERLQVFYRQEGFREAQVAVQVDTLEEGDRAQVSFRIQPGPPTYMRRVRYSGGGQLSDVQRRRMVQETILPLEDDALLTSPDDTLGAAVHEQRYSEPLLHEERQRLLSFLRDEGFAAATRDSIRALVFPRCCEGSGADSFDVTFRIRPGPRYRFGDVHFNVTGPEAAAATRTDTLFYPASDGQQAGQVTARIEEESKLRAGLLFRALQFRPGAWFDQSEVRATKRRLEAAGVFAFTDFTPEQADTAAGASLAVRGEGALTAAQWQPEPDVPRQTYRVALRTRRRHQLRLETFMLQRSGVLSTTDSELGTGVGLTYENVNLLGGGERLRLRTTGSVAVDAADSTLFAATQGEITASLTYPYLIRPFSRLSRSLNLYGARTQLSLSWLTARRNKLRLMIRGRGNARFRLEMQHSPIATSLVDLMDLSLSNPDTLSGFKDRFLTPILEAVDDEVQAAQINEDYTQPQINNALRYTLRLARGNPLRRTQGYSYEVAFEVGSQLLPYALDRFVFTPGTVEGSLPGLPVFQGNGSSRLIYRRYLRFVGDVRRYYPLSANTVLAWKFIGGLAHPTGPSQVIPFERRFYSGGAASVRGWRLRELGPGAAPDSLTAGRNSTNLLGGDVKLEASLELRHQLLRQVMAARWIGVLFTDVGNVWLGPRNPGLGAGAGSPRTDIGRFELDRFYKEVGVGAGVGLRLAWKYLIARFDLAARVYDPQQRGLFPNGLRNPMLHFGIGHSF